MSLGSRGFILVAVFFVRILYAKLQWEIKQNQEKLEGFTSLGMRTMDFEFMTPPTFFFLKVKLSILFKSNLIVSYKTLKNWMENPSSLGTLSCSKPHTAWIIYSSVISLSKASFSSFETLFGIFSSISCMLVSTSSSFSWEYRVPKCYVVSSLIFSKLDVVFLEANWILPTVFMCHLAWGCLWKNEVFLSLERSQRLHNFILHSSSYFH